MKYINSIIAVLFIASIFIFSGLSAGDIKENKPLGPGNPYIANIDITQFDTTGWIHLGIRNAEDTYARYFVQDYDTVYMIPSDQKYIFKINFANAAKGRLIYDNLNTSFGEEFNIKSPFNVMWRKYGYKIHFLWEDNVITVTTWF